MKGSPPNPNLGSEPKRLKVADVKSSGEEAEEKKKKEEKRDEKKEEKKRKRADEAKGSSRDPPKEEKKKKKDKKKRASDSSDAIEARKDLQGSNKRSRVRKRSKDSVSRSINKGCKCEKGEWKLRAKAQAKWFKRTTVSQKESTNNKAVRKELRLEAES